MLALDEMIQTSTDAPDPEGFKGLEHCPDFDERFTLANGRDRAVPYPQTGYNCTKDYALVQTETNMVAPDPEGWSGLEHCPDFDERFTLANGRDKAIPYPQPFYNCNANWSLSQSKSEKLMQVEQKSEVKAKDQPWLALEHCPDFDERMTLLDGKTVGVPYPKEGYNCNADWALVQKKSKDNT